MDADGWMLVDFGIEEDSVAVDMLVGLTFQCGLPWPVDVGVFYLWGGAASHNADLIVLFCTRIESKTAGRGGIRA